MEQTLLLNATYEPLRLISWQKAVTLLTLGKVEVIEHYDQEIHSISFSIQLPAVVRLLYLVKRQRQEVKFSRRNLYARDKGRCQYCGASLQPKEITYDHIVPKSHGGQTTWENVVTCCLACNSKKANRTPKQAKMSLLTPPRKPQWHHFLQITIGIKHAPESWKDYLYWNIEIET